jgi:Helix-turn-helix domain
MLNLEHFVDAAAAAQFLGCSPTHLLKLARDGQVPAHPLGDGDKTRRRTWRFRLSELETFMLNGGSK